ncbi:MAG TPA: endonuclease III [Acidimicrobiales bacterium]|nr:endonuclease III [Acidimicrobiales bacterium]
MGKPRSPRGRAATTAERLAELYPGTADQLCALVHSSPFELLVATILSAQCTDERVNMVTPALLERFPTPQALASAEPGVVEELVKTTGFFRNKTISLIGMAQGVVDRFGGEVPSAMEDLTTLPGVGRKTANVIRSVAFGLPGLPVDTHVGRLSKRIGLTTETDPVKVEAELCGYLPPAEWGGFSLRMILHGRQVCAARTPKCHVCVLADFCPSAPSPRKQGVRSS